MRRYDSHVHVWPPPNGPIQPIEPEDLDRLPGPRFTFEDLLAETAELGIQGFNLVQKKQWLWDMSYILHAIAAHPKRFVGTALVDIRSDNLAEQVEALAAGGISAIRIHPKLTSSEPKDWLQQQGYYDLWEICASRGLVLSCMTGPDCNAEIGRMCKEFRNAKVVIDHMGSAALPMEVYLPGIFSLLELNRFPNVHVKLSGFYSQGRRNPPYHDLRDVAGAIINAFGPSRCLWGSDGPYQMKQPHSYSASLQFIQDLPHLSDSDREWILGKTAEELLFQRLLRDE